MAKIKIYAEAPLYNGMPVTFKAPCDCSIVDGLSVQYGEDKRDFAFKDAHGNELTGIGNLFAKDAIVKAVLDTDNGGAYVQNADTNAYLEGRFAKTVSSINGQRGDIIMTAQSIGAAAAEEREIDVTYEKNNGSEATPDWTVLETVKGKLYVSGNHFVLKATPCLQGGNVSYRINMSALPYGSKVVGMYNDPTNTTEYSIMGSYMEDTAVRIYQQGNYAYATFWFWGVISGSENGGGSGGSGGDPDWVQALIDTAQRAEQTANDAKGTADRLAAQESLALEQSGQALSKANDALSAAQSAQTAADGAQDTADMALFEANNNAADIEEMKEKVKTVDYSLVANALKGSTSGNAIALDDVSPFEHTLGVKARSKNIIPLPYYNESGYEDNGITYTYGADGIIYASGTSTAVSRFYITPYDPYLPISVGTYIISIAGTGIDGKNIQLIGNIYSQSKNEYFEIYYDGSRSLIRNIGNGGKFRLYLYIPSGVTLENAEIRVQMEKGTTATEYAPYVEVEQRKVLATGKNLVDIDSMVNDLLADNGNGTYTFTAIADGQGSSDVAQLAIKQGSSITLSFTMVASGGEYNPNSVGMMFDYADGTSERLSVWKDAGYTKTWTATKDIAGVEFHHYGGSYGKWFTIKDLQIEYGEAKTAYEKFKGITEYSVNADGTVDGVQSISPNMTLLTDTSGVVLDVQYNKDSNIVIGKLIDRIAALEAAAL